METSRNKQSLSFKLHTILNSVMKSATIPPGRGLTLCPAQPAPQCLSSHSGYQIHCQGAPVCVQVTLISLSNSPKA